jgi:hypothetical protein
MSISHIKTIDLQNIGIIKGHISDDALTILKQEVKELESNFNLGTPHNKELAGHIRKEFLLHKSREFIGPLLIDLAMAHNDKYKYVDPDFDVIPGEKYKFELESLWVNFQQKHEFNPIHRHGGIYSFVIWLEVPYFSNFEKDISPGKNANACRTGMFEFTYTDILGRIRGETIPVDKTYEGDVILFPAKLHHQVYPFYSSDKYRISVAGNIKVIKSNDT